MTSNNIVFIFDVTKFKCTEALKSYLTMRILLVSNF